MKQADRIGSGRRLAGLLARSPTQLMIALVVASLAGVVVMVPRPSSAAQGRGRDVGQKVKGALLEGA